MKVGSENGLVKEMTFFQSPHSPLLIKQNCRCNQADTLSPHPSTAQFKVTFNYLWEPVKKDRLQPVTRYVSNNWLTVSVEQGRLHSNERVIIPATLRSKTLKLLVRNYFSGGK